MLTRASLLILIVATVLHGEDFDEAMRRADAAYRTADYATARECYEKAWELAQQTTLNNPVRYDVLKRLTSVRAAQSDFAGADNYLQLAINWRETTLGPEDPGVADDLLESVTICRGMKNFDRALAILERVLVWHTKIAGAESLSVAADFGRMAQIYLDQKKPEGAANSLAAALKIRTKLAGPYDASLLPDLDRLGETQITLQRYESAEETFRQALIIRESLLGKDSGELIQSVDGLAYACFGQKKYHQADPLYHRLITLWTASVGKEHPMVALAYDKVAVFYAEQKKFEEAKDAAEHANALRAHFLATGLAQEATEQQAEGNNDATKILYRKALAVLQPPDPIYDELRMQIEAILKSMDAPKPKKRKLERIQ